MNIQFNRVAFVFFFFFIIYLIFTIHLIHLGSRKSKIELNYDVPKCIHSYLHRIGRSGRWGRKGNAINFITKYDIKNIKTIEQYYQTEIKELPLDFVNS